MRRGTGPPEGDGDRGHCDPSHRAHPGFESGTDRDSCVGASTRLTVGAREGRAAGERVVRPGAGDAALRWFAGLAGGLTLAALMLYWLVPPARQTLYRENQGVEWATAALFLAAAVVGTRRLWTIGAGWWDPRWLIPGLSFVAMLDEVGWVVFALGVKPPTMLGKRVDAVHDFAEIGVTWIRLYAPQWALVLVGAVFAGAVLCLLATAPRWWRGLIGSPSWRFFMIAAGFGIASQILDIDLARDNFLKTLEEVFELDGSLALVFSASLLRRRPEGMADPR